MENRYKHNFNDGDIVTDLEYKEVFVFKDKTDGFRAELNPTLLRLATKEEIDILNGQEYTKLSDL